MIEPIRFKAVKLPYAMTRFRYILLIFILFGISNQVAGQVRIGIKGGLSTFDLSPSDLVILDRNDAAAFKMKIDDAKYGIHIGFFIQAKTDFLFIQPEVLFNSNSIDYAVEDIQTGDIRILDENYQQLDFPVMVGFRIGVLRLGAGPVGHLAISSTSDLLDVEGYEQSFKGLTWGWQGGLGLDLWKLHFDIRYEGNLSNFGDHIVFFGKRYPFDERPSRLIASLGISF
jgi:hypothetical protein